MTQKIVIIGGGIAGLSAAQSARETNPQARIYLICGEKRLPYYRTRICEIFSGLSADKLIVRSKQWFSENKIEVVYEIVASINHDNNQIKYTDGSYLFYDKLIFATGASGNIPECEGNDRDNVIALRFMSEVDKVSQYSGQVVIIGDGLLGLEAAWHLSSGGRSVVIIGRGDRLLSRQLDKEGSSFFLSIVEKAGIRVALNGTLQSIEDRQVALADGRAFEAAVVVFAAGIRSDFTLAKEMGIACNRAIVVDEQMQTSLSNAWACGDCAQYEGRVYGLWTASRAQGKIAGNRAAGGDNIYQPDQPAYFMNSMGTSVWCYGNVDATDGACIKDSTSGELTKLFFEDDKLVGAELIGDTAAMAELKKSIALGINRREAEKSFFMNKSS